MGFLNRLLRREKNKKEVVDANGIKVTELEELCSQPEVYEALRNTMILDPQKIVISYEDALSRAKEFEKAKENLRAAIWYRIAGGLAIYEGNVLNVKKCFSKYAELTKKSLKILEIPEKAVEKAQEYYKKYLKRKI